MKDKKAVKRLSKVEAILAEVIDGHATIDKAAGDLLASAKLSVGRARETLNVKTAAKAKDAKLQPKSPKTAAPAAPKGKRTTAPKDE